MTDPLITLNILAGKLDIDIEINLDIIIPDPDYVEPVLEEGEVAPAVPTVVAKDSGLINDLIMLLTTIDAALINFDTKNNFSSALSNIIGHENSFVSEAFITFNKPIPFYTVLELTSDDVELAKTFLRGSYANIMMLTKVMGREVFEAEESEYDNAYLLEVDELVMRNLKDEDILDLIDEGYFTRSNYFHGMEGVACIDYPPLRQIARYTTDDDVLFQLDTNAMIVILTDAKIPGPVKQPVIDFLKSHLTIIPEEEPV